MGNTYEVSVWSNDNLLEKYMYTSVWRGESRKEALKQMDQYSKKYACVKLEYRP